MVTDGLEAYLGGLALAALGAQQTPADFWQHLPAARRYTVAATYFMLTTAPLAAGGVTLTLFVDDLMERLLQGLSRRTRREEAVYAGRVRGKINWPATYKARYGRDYDPSRFACRELRYEYDTPENQLLRFLAQRLWESLHLIPESARRGQWLAPGELAPTLIAPRLSRLESRLNDHLRHVHFREISLPTHVTPEHLLRAGTHRSEEYASVAILYRHYERIVRNGEWGPARDLLRTGLVIPAGEEPLWQGVNVAVLRA